MSDLNSITLLGQDLAADLMGKPGPSGAQGHRPRTPVLIAITEAEGLRGPHLKLFEAIGRVHPEVLGRRLPLNGAGTCGARLLIWACRLTCCGFALLARTAGLLGQLAEEQRRPIGMDLPPAPTRTRGRVCAPGRLCRQSRHGAAAT
jgi:hypothetical protein